MWYIFTGDLKKILKIGGWTGHSQAQALCIPSLHPRHSFLYPRAKVLFSFLLLGTIVYAHPYHRLFPLVRSVQLLPPLPHRATRRLRLSNLVNHPTSGSGWLKSDDDKSELGAGGLMIRRSKSVAEHYQIWWHRASRPPDLMIEVLGGECWWWWQFLVDLESMTWALGQI